MLQRFKSMNKTVCLFLTGLSAILPIKAANVYFTGGSLETISITPEKSTGLDALYVVFDDKLLSEMRISGISPDATIMKYSNLGGGYAEPVSFRYDGGEAVVENPAGDLGYLVASEGKTTYFWVVNYAAHYLQMNALTASINQDCDNTIIDFNGNASAIHYYTIDGRPVELSRQIRARYNNLEWDEASRSYIQTSEQKELSNISSSFALYPPLYCNSVVTLSGDRFLDQWGRGITINSPVIHANGLAVNTSAEQTNLPSDSETDSNIIKTDVDGIGGSAPVDVEFRAYTTDAVVHNEWQIASDQNFDYIDYRFNEQNLDYTFNEEGTYYIRFVGSNADGTCETTGDTYTVGVGASQLKIPNAFTPNGDGINDEWKVAYRSLSSFSCTIFDRYGNELFRFTDPSKGWDGKYKGKNVKPGVYFYVIEATGTDGKKYKKGGDINIINAKRYGNENSPVN